MHYLLAPADEKHVSGKAAQVRSRESYLEEWKFDDQLKLYKLMTSKKVEREKYINFINCRYENTQ